jgi:ketosteroid isomerase-like protein
MSSRGLMIVCLVTAALGAATAAAQAQDGGLLERLLNDGAGADWRDRLDDVLNDLEEPDPAETRKEIDALVKVVADAVNQDKIDEALTHATEDAILVLPNGRLAQGADEIGRYYRAAIGTQADAAAHSVKLNPTIDGLVPLRGGLSAIVTGTSDDELTLAGGRTLALRSRWTATVVRQEGQWRVASLQATVNVFDNPLLNAATQALYWVGGGAGLAGVLLGAIGGRLFGRKRQ